MNEKGEVTLFGILMLVILSGLVTLCGLELESNYQKLVKRTQIYLCTKKTKIETHAYLTFMGKSNWAIKHIDQARFIMMLIPGLQGASLQASKLKNAIKQLQLVALVSYLKNLKDLKSKSCPLDPKMLFTPFKLQGLNYQRNHQGLAILRNKQWIYHFINPPYHLQLDFDAAGIESLQPALKIRGRETRARLPSL